MHVEQDGDLRREGHGVLELEATSLADDRRLAAASRRPARLTAVPTLPATATGSPASRWIVAEQLGRRRLAVRPGDGDERRSDQAPGELELAEHGEARARAPGGRPAPPAGRPGSSRRPAALLELGQAVGAQLAVRGPSARSPRACSTCRTRRAPGAGEADHEVRPAGQRRARRHVTGMLLVDREADRGADGRDDPEAQDDLRLRPARARSGGGSGPSGTRACGRSGRRRPGSDAQRLDHEDPAEQDQQHLGLRHHRHRRRSRRPGRASRCRP